MVAGDAGPYPFHNVPRFLQRLGGQNDGEFLPAVSGGKIVGSNMEEHLGRNLLQRDVADPVAVGVVHFLEVIDIENRQLHGKRIGLLVIDQPAQVFMESLMVV
ncbi:hypothetical protein D3C71_1640150 [compost metagenome]